MGATGVELEAHQRVAAEALQQGPVGAGMAAAVVVHHGVFLAIGGMATDGAHDRAVLRRGHAVHHRQVFAGGDALLDLHLQLHQCFLALGHDDAAGGVFIEAVHDAGPQLAADPR